MANGMAAVQNEFPSASLTVEDWMSALGLKYPRNMKYITVGIFPVGMEIEVAQQDVDLTMRRAFDTFVSPVKGLIIDDGDPADGVAREFQANDAGLDMNKWFKNRSSMNDPPYLFYDFEVT